MRPLNRIGISIAIGLASAIVCLGITHRLGSETIDFMWSYYAARDLAAGRDPYAAKSHADMIPYPLTAAILAAPLAWLPVKAASASFVGISSALLAFGLLRTGERWRLMVFASAPYYMAVRSVQWSPLLMLAMLYPVLFPLAMAKPQYFLPLSANGVKPRNLVACLAVAAVSLVIDPTWPLRWLAKLGPYSGFIPAFTVAGIALIGLVPFWRDERARLLLSMSLMPQQRYIYDALPIWMIPKNRSEMLTLTALSWVACAVCSLALDFRTYGRFWIVACIYLPAMAMVVRSRVVAFRGRLAGRRTPESAI